MDALEYRTISHGTKEEAAAFEAELAGNRASSLFQT
jgi:hypothetical protein